MNIPRRPFDKLSALLDAVEDDILAASDEEIVEQYIEEGRDPNAVSAMARERLACALKEEKKKTLRAAKEGLRKLREREGMPRPSIPDNPLERRALLKNMMTGRSHIPAEITMAYRDGTDVSDDDVLSTLEDLAELGLLNDEIE